MDLKKILKKASGNWAAAKKRVGEDTSVGFVEIPDGRYTARLMSAKIGESANGRAQVLFGWVIEDGEFEKKSKTDFQGIESEENLFYLGKTLERLGYEAPDDIMELPGILKDIERTKPLGVIRLRTKPGSDFQNVYIQKVYHTDEGEEAEDVEETDDLHHTPVHVEKEKKPKVAPVKDDEDEDEDDVETDDVDDDTEEDEEEEASVEDDDEGVEIAEGMRVMVETAKGREAGTIIELLEKEEKVRVKLDSDKTVKVGLDRIEVEPETEDDEDDDEEEETPVAKPPAKKVTPAPAKKTAAPAGKKTTRR